MTDLAIFTGGMILMALGIWGITLSSEAVVESSRQPWGWLESPTGDDGDAVSLPSRKRHWWWP